MFWKQTERFILEQPFYVRILYLSQNMVMSELNWAPEFHNYTLNPEFWDQALNYQA